MLYHKVTNNTLSRLILLLAVFLFSIPAFATKEEKTCLRLMNHIVKHYKHLYSKLPPKKKRRLDTPSTFIANMKSSDCKTDTKAQNALSNIIEAVANHDGKIGVLLPMSGIYNPTSQAIIDGMKAHFKKSGIKFEDQVIVKKTFGNIGNMEQALSELVFDDHVGIVIGGTTKAEATRLAAWGEKLLIPVLLISKKEKNVPFSKYVYHIFPSEKEIVNTIFNYAKIHRYRRLGILRPVKSKPSRLVELLISEAPKHGIEINKNILYTPRNYHSMESASKKMFEVDRIARHDELKEIYNKAKRKAKKEKVAFNPQMVSLPPKIEVDAIFIPDNFRAIRHFVKIFEFIGVKKIPLIGNQEWRAFGLVDPPEPFLDGSIFVDYIGSYQNLPEGIEVKTPESQFFVKPEEAAKIDFRIIGYHSMKIAKLALNNPRAKRRKLAKKIGLLQIDNSSYFKKGLAFDKSHQSNWPSFLFQISKRSVNLYPIDQQKVPKTLMPLVSFPTTIKIKGDKTRKNSISKRKTPPNQKEVKSYKIAH